MTAHTWNTMLSRSALLALAATGLVACGPREPSTPAERLARGRELVQQMSARLASAKEVSVTTTEMREVVRLSGKKEPMSGTGEYTCDAPITSAPSPPAAKASKPGTTGKF